jgi:hypothetical protein
MKTAKMKAVMVVTLIGTQASEGGNVMRVILLRNPRMSVDECCFLSFAFLFFPFSSHWLMLKEIRQGGVQRSRFKPGLLPIHSWQPFH